MENKLNLTPEQAADYYTNLHPETSALSDEELDSASGGILATMDADGNFIPVSEVPMPKYDPQKGSDLERMLKNIKNAPPIDPLHAQDKADLFSIC